jgi:hypothetical protein
MLIDGDPAAELRLQPSPDHDGIAAAELVLDRPWPGARFVVEVAGFRREATFAPSPGQPASFSFAFGSCHQPFAVTPRTDLRLSRRAGIYRPMRQALAERDARFLLLIGDQVYTDRVPALDVRQLARRNPHLTDDQLLERFRLVYRGYFNDRGFRDLLSALPASSIWDDHDIFEGWGSHADRKDEDERLFRAAERAYVEYQQMRNSGATWDDTPSHYYHFWYGDVGFFVLDVRAMRDFRTGELLGKGQWRAVDRFLAEAAHRSIRTLFFVASEPLVHFAPALIDALERVPRRKKNDVRDRLNNARFRPERDALLDRLFAWQSGAPARQLLLLSGDVHCATVMRLRAKRGRGQLLQWTSSALSTRPPVRHHVMNQLGAAFPGVGDDCCFALREGIDRRNNFGMVDVRSIGGGGHAVSLTIRAYDLRRRRLVESLESRAGPGR